MGKIMVAAATIGAGVLGAGASAFSGSKAASAQKDAASQANNTQMQMFNTLQENLSPYKNLGEYTVNNLLRPTLPDLAAPIVMDQAALEKTPGYQFQLQQGLKGIQNSASAKGLGVSGRALKGAADYTTGLANSNYQQQFQNAMQQRENTYNRLLGIANLGENAAAGIGSGALSTGQQIGQNQMYAGQAQAGAYTNAGNAFGQAAQSVPNGMFANQLLGMYGKQGSQWMNPDYQ